MLDHPLRVFPSPRYNITHRPVSIFTAQYANYSNRISCRLRGNHRHNNGDAGFSNNPGTTFGSISVLSKKGHRRGKLRTFHSRAAVLNLYNTREDMDQFRG